MKKIFTLAAATMLAVGVNAQVITLDLTNPANPETIEYNEDGSWVETYNDEIPYIEFTPFMFSHVLGGSWGGYYWDGFTITKSGDTTDWYSETSDWVSHQWYSITGGGVKTENGEIVASDGVAEADPEAPFLVGYYGSDYAGATYEACNVMFNDGNQYMVMGVYVTNHTWPYYSYTNGDDFARAFDQEGDFLKIIAHGIDADGNETATSEFILASYNNGELQAVDQWTWWDLSALGVVDQINFTMDSSDKGDWGINTAKYFCMDKLQVINPDDLRTIEGVVVDPDNNPLAGVNVTATLVADEPAGLFRNSAAGLTAVTGEDGAYSINVPADGTYSMTFEKEGYETKTVGEVDAANVTLELAEVVGVDDVNAAKAVTSVRYMNMAGQQSQQPFEGVNVVVTRYTDGTTSTTKVVR